MMKPSSELTHQLRQRFADAVSAQFEAMHGGASDDKTVDIDEVTVAVIQLAATMTMLTPGRTMSENIEWGIKNFVTAAGGMSGTEVKIIDGEDKCNAE